MLAKFIHWFRLKTPRCTCSGVLAWAGLQLAPITVFELVLLAGKVTVGGETYFKLFRRLEGRSQANAKLVVEYTFFNVQSASMVQVDSPRPESPARI